MWEDKHKRLEAHVIMHTARARAFQARDPALLKAEPESEHSEASDHHLDALDSPIHSPAQGPTTNDLQPPTTKTASISEVRPDSTKEDELIAGAKKGCNDVGAQTLGSGGHLHRKGPSMTGDKGSQPIIDLTNASDESEDMDVARSANAAPKKRREPKTQHKPTPANAASPSGPKGERREVPPTKRDHADGAKGSANKRKKQTVRQASPLNGRLHSLCAQATRTPTTVGTSSRPTQGRKPPLPSTTVINYSAPGAASQLFEPVLGAGTSVIRDSEEPEEWEASYKEFLPME